MLLSNRSNEFWEKEEKKEKKKEKRKKGKEKKKNIVLAFRVGTSVAMVMPSQ